MRVDVNDGGLWLGEYLNLSSPIYHDSVYRGELGTENISFSIPHSYDGIGAPDRYKSHDTLSQKFATSIDVAHLEKPHERLCKTKDANNIEYILNRNESNPKWWIKLLRDTMDPDILTLLIVNGPDINGVDSMGNNLLFYIVHNHDIENVKYILKHPIDINHLNYVGYNPLCLSYKIGNKDIFDILYELGGDINTDEMIGFYKKYRRWDNKIQLLLMEPKNLFHPRFNYLYMNLLESSCLWNINLSSY